MNKILSLALLLLALGVAQGLSNPLVSVFTDKEGRMHYDWKMTLQDAGSGAISISNSPFPQGEFVWYRKVNATDFSVISTSNFSYHGSENARIYRGNIIDFVDEIDQDGKNTIKVTQFNFEQNITLPSFSINGSFVKSHVESKYVYVFSTEPQTLTLVRFTVGETKLGETIMIPVQIPYEDIQMAKFSNHKLLLTLSPSSETNSDPILQEIIVDLENGVSQINPIPVFDYKLSCKAYVNKKFYGSICVYPYGNYYITKNASQSSQNIMNMLPANYPYRNSVSAVYPTGDYILTIHKDPENRGYYQLLDLETMQSISLVGFGKYDYFLPVEFYQIENGDVYVMAITQGLDFSNNDYYISNIQLKIIYPNASTEEDATSEDDKLIQYFLA